MIKLYSDGLEIMSVSGLKKRFLNVAFPINGPSETWLEENNLKCYVGNLPPECAPHQVYEKQGMKLNGNVWNTNWVLRDKNEEEILQDKILLAREAAQYRKSREIGGIEVGGLNVDTGDRSKTLINGAYNDALRENDPLRERTFIISDLHAITVTNEQIIQIGLAIASHVQKCMTAGGVMIAAINSGEATTLQEAVNLFETSYSQDI